MTHGAEVPNSTGLGGGLPGAMVSQRFRAGGEQPRNLGPKPGSLPITPEDLFEVTWQGGGIGDPLDRDPADVLDDLRHGLVTPEEARETYGVVLSGDYGNGASVDAAATVAARRERRAARLGVEPAAVTDPSAVTEAVPDEAVRLGDRLLLVRDEATGQFQARRPVPGRTGPGRHRRGGQGENRTSGARARPGGIRLSRPRADFRLSGSGPFGGREGVRRRRRDA